MNTILILLLLLLFLVCQCEVIMLYNHLKELKSELDEYIVLRSICENHEKKLFEYYEDFARVFSRLDAIENSMTECVSNEEKYFDLRQANPEKSVKEISKELNIPYTTARRYEVKFKNK